MKLKVVNAILVLASVFMITLSSYAAGKTVLETNVPQIYGKSKDVFNGSSEMTVIHIQDAHGNVEAQENIQSLIKTFADEHGVDAIMDEAVFEENDYSDFEGFSKEDKTTLMDFYTKWAMKHAASRYHVLDNQSVPVLGADDETVYNENHKQFIDAHGNKKESAAMAAKIKGAMEALKLKIYDEDTRSFLQVIEDFANDKITLTSYSSVLKDKAEQSGVKWSSYNNFAKVVKSVELEENIDFAKIDRERLDLIDELEGNVSKDESDAIVSKSLNYRLGRLSAADYYKFLLKSADTASIDMDSYQNVVKYAELVKIYADINDDALFAEAERLENEIKGIIFKTDAQKNFDLHLKNIENLNRMINLQMTRTDLAYYNENKPSAAKAIAFLQEQAKAQNLGLEVTQTLAKIDDNLSNNENFYKTAIKRDDIMVEKTLAMMDERGFKTVVLVAGGFHSEGITKALKAKNINHMIVTPRITNPDAPNYWLQNMTGEKTEGTKLLEQARASVNAMNSKETKTSIVVNEAVLKLVEEKNQDFTKVQKTVDDIVAEYKDNANFLGIDDIESRLNDDQKANLEAIKSVLAENSLEVNSFLETGNSNLIDLGNGFFAHSLRDGNGLTISLNLLNESKEAVTAYIASIVSNKESLERADETKNIGAIESNINNLTSKEGLVNNMLQMNMSLTEVFNNYNKLFDNMDKSLTDQEMTDMGMPTQDMLDNHASDNDKSLLDMAANFIRNLMPRAVTQAFNDFMNKNDTLKTAHEKAQADRLAETVKLNSFQLGITADEDFNVGENRVVSNAEGSTVALHNIQKGDTKISQSKIVAEAEAAKAKQSQKGLEVTVMSLDEAENNKQAVIDAVSKGAVFFYGSEEYEGMDLEELISKAQEVFSKYTGDANKVSFLFQEASTTIAGNKIKSIMKKNKEYKFLEYEVTHGLSYAANVAFTAQKGESATAEVKELFDGMIKEGQEDEFNKFIEDYVKEGRGSYVKYVVPIQELVQMIADSNTAVAWMA